MGANDLLEQLQAAQAQSVIDERRIVKLEAELQSLRGEAVPTRDELAELLARKAVEQVGYWQGPLPDPYIDGDVDFRRLADAVLALVRPEVAAITTDDIRKAVAPVLVSATRYPRKVQPYILGQDMGPLIEAVVARVTALLRKDTP